jgi:hypothetical protein
MDHGAPAPPSVVRYCPPGQHRWAPRLGGDHPRQCWDCPACEPQVPPQPALLQAPRAWAEVGEERRRR